MLPPRTFQQFTQNRQGGIALLTGLLLFIMAAISGMAIDSGRYYLVRSKMSNALDAALIATGDIATADLIATNPGEIIDRGRNFFRANYPANYLGVDIPDADIVICVEGGPTCATQASADKALSDGTVYGEVTANVPMIFGGIYNLLDPASTANFDELEVGVFSQINRQSSSVEIAIVVDNSTSMCSDGSSCAKFASVQTGVQILVQTVTSAFDASLASDPNDGAYFSYIPYTHEVYRPGTPQDTSQINTQTCDPDISYQPAIGLQRIPDGDPYSSSKVGTAVGLSSNPDKPIQNESGTNTAKGIWWGWASLRPDMTALFNDPDNGHENPGVYPSSFDSVEDFSATKAMVILTDGNNAYPNLRCTGTASAAFRSGRFDGTSDTSSITGLTKDVSADTQLSNMCTTIKDQGILIYTVVYDIADPSIRTLMSDCSTGADYFFEAPTEQELIEAFEEISNSLIGLRIAL